MQGIFELSAIVIIFVFIAIMVALSFAAVSAKG